MSKTLLHYVVHSGYAGIAVLMLLEAFVPPLPSELIMGFAGYKAARGSLSLAGVIVAGTAGSMIGALLWYRLAKWLGDEKLTRLVAAHGRWLTIGPRDLHRAEAWFEARRGRAVLFGRLIPGLRSYVSIPAGICEMNLPLFLLASLPGTALWAGLLGGAGYVLGSRYGQIEHVTGDLAKATIGLATAIYLYRLATWRGDSGRRNRAPAEGH